MRSDLTIYWKMAEINNNLVWIEPNGGASRSSVCGRLVKGLDLDDARRGHADLIFDEVASAQQQLARTPHHTLRLGHRQLSAGQRVPAMLTLLFWTVSQLRAYGFPVSPDYVELAAHQLPSWPDIPHQYLVTDHLA